MTEHTTEYYEREYHMEFRILDPQTRRNVYSSRLAGIENDYLNQEVSLFLTEIAVVEGNTALQSEVDRLHQAIRTLEKQHAALVKYLDGVDHATPVS